MVLRTSNFREFIVQKRRAAIENDKDSKTRKS